MCHDLTVSEHVRCLCQQEVSVDSGYNGHSPPTSQPSEEQNAGGEPLAPTEAHTGTSSAESPVFFPDAPIPETQVSGSGQSVNSLFKTLQTNGFMAFNNKTQASSTSGSASLYLMTSMKNGIMTPNNETPASSSGESIKNPHSKTCLKNDATLFIETEASSTDKCVNPYLKTALTNGKMTLATDVPQANCKVLPDTFVIDEEEIDTLQTDVKNITHLEDSDAAIPLLSNSNSNHCNASIGNSDVHSDYPGEETARKKAVRLSVEETSVKKSVSDDPEMETFVKKSDDSEEETLVKPVTVCPEEERIVKPVTGYLLWADKPSPQ